MKILVLDAYFEPEITAFTHLEKDLIETAVNAGHEISIVCPSPSRAIDNATAKKYSKIKEESLYGGKVRVKRFGAPRETGNTLKRALRYFWCNKRMFDVAKKIKDADVIFSNSTPPIQALVAAKLKRKLKIPFVYNLQDVFPDSLVNAGMTKKGSLIWKIGSKIEKKAYSAADKIIVISEDFKNNLLSKGVPEEKIEVIYNWVDAESVRPIPRKDNKLFDELGIERNAFTVVYAGNFGKAQGAKVVFDAAKLLKDRNDIRFVLFGGGAEYDELLEYKEKNEIDNLIVKPLLSQDRVSEVYSLGNVCLITCKKGFGRSSFPSKTFSIMACNSKIIASYDTDSELSAVIAAAGAGISVEPENAQALAKAIVSAKLEQNKISAREFVLKTADKKICARRYVDAILSCENKK